MDTAQILKEIGIDVWRLRPARGSELSMPSGKPAEAPQAAAEARTEAPTVRPAQTATSKRPDTTTGPAIAPFCVLSLLREGVLLLTESTDLRNARRFGSDLLAACSGVWGGESRQLIFEWPQPGLDSAGPAMSRALGAFVAKQLDDLGDGTVLMDANIAGRLEQPDHRCLVIPPLDELMTDGDKKRGVWQEIVRRQTP